MEAFFFIAIVVLVIVGRPVLRAVAQNVYDKTGYDGLAILPKLMMYIVSIVTIGGVLLAAHVSNFLSLVVFLLGGIIMSLVNLKAGVANALLLGFIQVLCGVASIVGTIVSGMLRVAGAQMGNNTGASLNVNTALDISRKQVEKNTEEGIKYETERADAYAKHQGFRDADDAEGTYGIKTGKP